MKKNYPKNENTFRYDGITAQDGSIAFIIAFVFSLVYSFVLSTLVKNTDVLSIVYSVLSQLTFVAVAFSFSYKAFRRDCPDLNEKWNNSLHALGFNKKIKPSVTLISVVMPIFAILAFLPISALVEYLFRLWGYKQQPTYADYTSSVGMFIACIFALCVLPAFGEEMIMRGGLLRGLRQKGTVFAILNSALIFALMHGSPVQFIHQFLIGLVMAYAVALSDCIWYSVIFHFTNNFTVILYEFIYTKTGATYVIEWWMYLIMFVVGIAGLCGLLALFTRQVLRNTEYKTYVRENSLNGGSVECANKKSTRLKIAVKSAFDTTEYKYRSYDKTPCVAYYLALALVIVIWLINTIGGWTV